MFIYSMVVSSSGHATTKLQEKYESYGYTFQVDKNGTKTINGVPYRVITSTYNDQGISIPHSENKSRRGVRSNDSAYFLLLEAPHRPYNNTRPEASQMTLKLAEETKALQENADLTKTPEFFMGENNNPQK